MLQRYAGRVRTQRLAAATYERRRDTADGMRCALVDLIVLSRMHAIIGNGYSSFSTLAATLSGAPLHLVGEGDASMNANARTTRQESWDTLMARARLPAGPASVDDLLAPLSIH